jgi:hypothetical protein
MYEKFPSAESDARHILDDQRYGSRLGFVGHRGHALVGCLVGIAMRRSQ